LPPSLHSSLIHKRADFSIRMKVALHSHSGVGPMRPVLPDPPGMSFSRETGDKVDLPVSNRKALMQAQAQQMAMAPAGGLLQTAFMLWMCGTSIQIFSIFIISNALTNPLNALTSVNKYFSRFEKEEGVDLTTPKLIYSAVQCAGLAMALYKCSTMGLLPMTSADWTSLIPIKTFNEYSGIPL
jgi:hypothetical protein